MLLALTSASRPSNIHHLDIRFMFLSEEKVVFNFAKLLKAWKKGRVPPKLEIFAFEKDADLCNSNFKSVSGQITRTER